MRSWFPSGGSVRSCSYSLTLSPAAETPFESHSCFSLIVVNWEEGTRLELMGIIIYPICSSDNY